MLELKSFDARCIHGLINLVTYHLIKFQLRWISGGSGRKYRLSGPRTSKELNDLRWVTLDRDNIHRSDSQMLYVLKQKYCHFDKILVIGCTESCQNDNFRCSLWWNCSQNGDIFVSMMYQTRFPCWRWYFSLHLRLNCTVRRSYSNYRWTKRCQPVATLIHWWHRFPCLVLTYGHTKLIMANKEKCDVLSKYPTFVLLMRWQQRK